MTLQISEEETHSEPVQRQAAAAAAKISATWEAAEVKSLGPAELKMSSAAVAMRADSAEVACKTKASAGHSELERREASGEASKASEDRSGALEAHSGVRAEAADFRLYNSALEAKGASLSVRADSKAECPSNWAASGHSDSSAI